MSSRRDSVGIAAKNISCMISFLLDLFDAGIDQELDAGFWQARDSFLVVLTEVLAELGLGALDLVIKTLDPRIAGLESAAPFSQLLQLDFLAPQIVRADTR
jgi:hypothetical protein